MLFTCSCSGARGTTCRPRSLPCSSRSPRILRQAGCFGINNCTSTAEQRGKAEGDLRRIDGWKTKTALYCILRARLCKHTTTPHPLPLPVQSHIPALLYKNPYIHAYPPPPPTLEYKVPQPTSSPPTSARSSDSSPVSPPRLQSPSRQAPRRRRRSHRPPRRPPRPRRPAPGPARAGGRPSGSRPRGGGGRGRCRGGRGWGVRLAMEMSVGACW